MISLTRRALALGAALSLAVATLATAQSTTGRISGTVADSSGGVLPGVSVTATNEGTSLARTTTTDAQGGYVFVDMPIGAYTVKTELSGFKSAVKSGYALSADRRVTIDFQLDVGSVSDSV